MHMPTISQVPSVAVKSAARGIFTKSGVNSMIDGFPRWVDDEIHNWARSQWEGEWPGPGRALLDEPTVCAFPPQPGHAHDDEPSRIPVNHERARQVHRLYETLPLVEQRVIQAEYTRRAEYGDLPARMRQEKACRVIGVSLPYYKVALGSFKQQVWRMFE
ncbi:hypothetical protein [Achromobacter marplatensis]|uniref:Uncharacterized protein n=1 Tax=Achromobacter marplatensis TaxID=470868 RepID=A0AA43B1X3_9BURK|nr:hypothetical protein [Achromobacter marplatensis]MDH2052548.1 hypothetical protein [Achromobacter marplatensis]